MPAPRPQWSSTENQQQKTTRKPQNVWRLNNSLLNNRWVKKKSQEKIKSILDSMKMKIQLVKIFGMQVKQNS